MRLIDLDEFFKKADEYPEYWEEQLNEMPTVDAVPTDYIVSWLICNVFDAELGRMYANKMIGDWKYRKEMADWREKNGKAD